MMKHTPSSLVEHFGPAVQSKHLQQDSLTAVMYLSTNFTEDSHLNHLFTEKCWLSLQVHKQM